MDASSSTRQQRLVRLQSARYFYSVKSRRDAAKFEKKKLIKNKLRSLSKLNDELNECQRIYLNICINRIGEAHRLAMLIENLEQILISTDKTSLKQGKESDANRSNIPVINSFSLTKDNKNAIDHKPVENDLLINDKQTKNLHFKIETSPKNIIENQIEKKTNFEEDEISFANYFENIYNDKNQQNIIKNKPTSFQSDRIKMLKDSIEETISKLADLSNSSSLVSPVNLDKFAFERKDNRDINQYKDYKSNDHSLNQFKNQDYDKQLDLNRNDNQFEHQIEIESKNDKDSSIKVSKQLLKKQISKKTCTLKRNKTNSPIEDTITISNLDQLFKIEEERTLSNKSTDHRELTLNEFKNEELNKAKNLNVNSLKDDNQIISLKINAKKVPLKASKIKSNAINDLNKEAINLENLDTDLDDFYSLEQEGSEQDYKFSFLESKKDDLIIETDSIEKIESFNSTTRIFREDLKGNKNFKSDNLVYRHKKYLSDYLDENLSIRTPSLRSLELFSSTDDLPNFNDITPTLSSSSSFPSIDILISFSPNNEQSKCPKCYRKDASRKYN